jgi:predicted phosphohydrolase
MLFRPFSDLHAEFWPEHQVTRILESVVPPLATDRATVALIAGDLGLAHRREKWLKVLELLAGRFLAVVCVEGNHFFYHNDFFGRIQALKEMVCFPGNVHFLENESVEVEDAVIIGATLWTDFDGKNFFKMQHARKQMNDFRTIRKASGELLLPEDTADLFYQSREFIFDRLKEAEGRKTIVLTHHGISPLSVHERYRGDSLNWAFMTDLSGEIMDHGPDLWVHGHTHDSFDYLLGRTRVVVNPYGYQDVEINPGYNGTLLIRL